MFELQEQPPSSGTTCQAGVLKWRRKPMAIIFLLIWLAFCLAGACVLSTFDPGDKIKSWSTVTFSIWVGFLLTYLLLTGRHTIEVCSEGIRFRSLVATRDLPWDHIHNIQWKYSRNEMEPLARSIRLRVGPKMEFIEELGFMAGEEPLLNAILRYWSPPTDSLLTEVWNQGYHRARVRQLGLLGTAFTLATIGTLSALKVAGALVVYFSWTAVVLAPITLFLGFGLLFSPALARDSRERFDGYRDVGELPEAKLPDPSTIQHNPKTALADALFRRFLPPPPEKLLPDEQIRELQHRMTRLDQQGTRLGLALMLPLIALFTYLPYRVNLLFQDAAIDPVMDTRSKEGWMWLLPGMFFGMIVSLAVLKPIFTWRYGREEMHLFSCYQTTVKGYDTRRSMRYLYAFCMGFVVLGSLFAWRNGYVVDQNGIRFKPGLVRSYSHPYSDVRTIGVYRCFDAPIGIQKGPRIRITFREGPSLVESMRPSDKRFAEWLQAVEYISQRSDVPVEHGDMAPKE